MVFFYFNPLRPWGRRLRRETRPGSGGCISTHSARGGGDDEQTGTLNKTTEISTHSARGGGDVVVLGYAIALDEFQPTPPVGAETAG